MKTVLLKPGDIFYAKVTESSKKYFQYVGVDYSQLDSDVIVVFKKTYPIDAPPDLSQIAHDDIDFHAHCMLKLGQKLGFWAKIGNHDVLIDWKNFIYRDSDDYGEPSITVSDKWRVWKPSQEHVYVGKLKAQFQEAEIGIVIPPDSIVHRMIHGKYDFKYPNFHNLNA